MAILSLKENGVMDTDLPDYVEDLKHHTLDAINDIQVAGTPQTYDVKAYKQFEYTYQNDSDGFVSFLKDVLFDVPNDYNKSWEYIFLDNNSVKRCSNAYLMFDILNKNLK